MRRILFQDKLFIRLAAFICIGVMLIGCDDSTTWEAAQKANTYEAYQAYMTANPEGEHLAEAQKLAENSYWETIKKDTLSQSFQKYLQLFPKGSHKLKAEILLGQLSSGIKMGAKARVTGSSVIIRGDHTTEASSVGVVAKEGTVVQVLDWYSVGANNEALLNQNITVVSQGQRFNLQQGKAVQVLSDLGDSLHVSFATPNSASVEAIISKDVIESMSGNMWYKIHTKDNITGWVYGEFIEQM